MDMIFGKLGWDSIPTEPIVLVTMVLMAIGAIAVLGGITYFKKMGIFVERVVYYGRP